MGRKQFFAYLNEATIGKKRNIDEGNGTRMETDHSLSMTRKRPFEDLILFHMLSFR